MAKPVRLEAEAKREVDEAAIHVEDDTGHGDRFLEAVSRTLAWIAKYPDAFPISLHRESGIVVREARVKKFAYRLVYAETSSELRVIALAHDRRTPGFWHDRMP